MKAYEVAAECAQECAYGVCRAPGSYQGCGGCCGCLGPCVVTWEKTQQATGEGAAL